MCERHACILIHSFGLSFYLSDPATVTSFHELVYFRKNQLEWMDRN